MKTVPFNAEQAKAGRPVISSNRTLKFIATCGKHVWCVCPTSDCGPLTYYAEELSHPADPAPGHNPAQLDEWTVGTHDGWRLLEGEEISARLACYELRSWNTKWQRWDDSPAEGSSRVSTYRTRRPAGYFLPKVVTRNIRQEELPDEFLVKDAKCGIWITTARHYTSANIAQAVIDGEKLSRSLDGPWNKFTVEEKQ